MTDEERAAAIAEVEQTLRRVGLLEHGFAGEVQLLDWSKSTCKDGPKIKLLLPDDESMSPFELATIRKGKTAGQLYYLFAIRVDESHGLHRLTHDLERDGIARMQHDAKPYGKQASELYRHGWFFAPGVLPAIGTDDEFLSWVCTKPCVAGVAVGSCDGDIVPAHVRRVALGSGTAIKPPYAAIPLCHHHHTLQHQHGESALGGKEWFERQRARHVAEWASHKLATTLGFTSMGHVPPAALALWAEAHNLMSTLPRAYREPTGGNDGSNR